MPARRKKGYSQGGPPPGLRPVLLVKLGRGWRLDAKGGGLVSSRGQHVELVGLPARTEVRSVLPPRARAAKASAVERELERFVHVVLPSRANAARILEVVRRWKGVEAASLPPDIHLP
jgi:hypothetical protein